MKDVEFVEVRSKRKSMKKIRKAGKESDVFVLSKQRGGESDIDYMRRVYRENEKFLHERQLSGRAMATEGRRSWRNFRDSVESRSENFGMDVKKAIKSHIMSSYMSGEEVARMNSIQALKNQGFYGMFREFSKERGRYAKFSMKKLSYDFQESMYSYETDKGRVLFGWRPLSGTKSPMFFQMIEEVGGMQKRTYISKEPVGAKY